MDSNNLQEPLLHNDWRTELEQDGRERVVNKIAEMLKKHIPFSGQEGLQDHKKIAVIFEEKIYTIATSKSDYLRKISLKMLNLETRSQNRMANSNAASNSENVQEPASQSMQPQMQNPIQNNVPSTGVPNSADSTPALPPLNGKSQGTMPSVPLQNPNVQNTFSTNPFAQRNPVMQAWPSNSMFQFQSQSQIGMPDFQLGTNLKLKKKAFTPVKKIHAVQQPQMPSNEGQVKSQMQPMMMPMQQHNPFSSISSVSNSRQNMLGRLQSGSSIDNGQGNVLNQMQQVASNSLQQNLVGGSQQNGLTALQSNANSLQSNSIFLQPQQINTVQQMFSTQQPMQQYQQQQMLLQHLLRQQKQQQQLIQQLSQKQSAQQLVGQQQQTCQKKSAQEQVASNALQQNPVGCFRPMTSFIATKNGLTALQSGAKSLQSNSNVLQPQEQQMFSTFQLMQQQHQHQQILQQHVLRQQLFQQQVQQQIQQEFQVVQQLMQQLSEKQSAQQLVREQEQTSQKKSVQQQTSLKKSAQKETSKKQSGQETTDGYIVLGICAVLLFFMMMVIFTM